MSSQNRKDIVIIGGGSAGYTAAIHAAHLGASVALIEKDKLGGTCLNRGCIPTKALTRSIEVLGETKKAAEFGVVADNVRADFQKIMSRKSRIVQELVSGVEQLIKMNRITLIKGAGRIIPSNQVQVNDQVIPAGKIIIATGSVPAKIPVPGIDLPGVMTTDDILELKEVPESLIIIGGSYVGVEFAGIFGPLGTKVTILEQLPTCLATVDEEISRLFSRNLARQGVEVKTGAKVKAIKKYGDILKAVYDTADGEAEAQGQMILLATGRVPYTGETGLSELGIRMAGRGIAVNDYLETNIDGIYAAGDVLGRIMLAHVAYYEAEVAVENALGRARKTDYRAVPSCIFTHPEIASVGVTEQDAREKNIPYKVSKFPFTASARAKTMGETDGTVKLICHAESGLVLGLHILGPHASDLIAEGALAIRMGATAKDIAQTIHAHPTLPESVREAAMGQLEGSIHFGRIRL